MSPNPNYVQEFLNAPETTDEQGVKFAILCAMEVCTGQELSEWRTWAEKWLNSEGQDIRPEFDTWALGHNHPPPGPKREAQEVAYEATYLAYLLNEAHYLSNIVYGKELHEIDVVFERELHDREATLRPGASMVVNMAQKYVNCAVEAEAKRWSPENWKAVFDVWYEVRKIDFEKLIEKAKVG